MRTVKEILSHLVNHSTGYATNEDRAADLDALDQLDQPEPEPGAPSSVTYPTEGPVAYGPEPVDEADEPKPEPKPEPAPEPKPEPAPAPKPEPAPVTPAP